MINKPKITVAADDGRGKNRIQVEVEGIGTVCDGESKVTFGYSTLKMTLYYAIERIVELEAHVERQSDLLNRFVAAMTTYEMDVESDSPPPRDHRAMMSDAKSALKEQPSTSLARIRAEAKAEALEDFRSEFELHCEVPDFILGCLEEYADEYRKQAEEGEE